MLVLGIETSCDETAIALVGPNGPVADVLHSQTLLHEQYGGVVPELAARDHVQRLPQLFSRVMDMASVRPSDIEGVACTAGPGLITALLVGVRFASAFAQTAKIPLVGVHHMEGHLLSPYIGVSQAPWPVLALLISGGHTMLVHAKSLGDYTVIGDTLDDAVGEAFDKTARLMGLPYPGGPEIERLAKDGDPKRFAFPRPMIKRGGCDFSFSGLKTAVMRTWDNDVSSCPSGRADVAASLQAAIAETLASRLRKAIRLTGVQHVLVAGGVAANLAVRDAIQHVTDDEKCALETPAAKLCTDNAVMIANVGRMRLTNGERATSVSVTPRWNIDELSPPSALG